MKPVFVDFHYIYQYYINWPVKVPGSLFYHWQFVNLLPG